MAAPGNTTRMPLRERLGRRLVQLLIGLTAYGVSVALLIEAHLGLDPWDVFHQGLSRRTGISIGLMSVLVSGVVLVLWIPLRQRPGVGTVCNAILVGLVIDAALWLLPTAGSWWSRGAFLVGGIALNGLATGLYIGARLGPGPRDGLMTGLNARTGRSIRLVRTVIEVTVLVIGFALGGTVGIGTLLYAVSIGPLAHVFIPLFTVRRAPTAVAG